MPTDACQFFYECTRWTKLRPKPVDCCVFCPDGPVHCLPCRRSDRARRMPTLAACG